MATIRQAITLQDKMSPVLTSIVKAMKSTIQVMEQLDRATQNGASATAWKDVKDSIGAAEDALDQFGKKQNNINDNNRKIENGFKSWQKAIITAQNALQLVEQAINIIEKPIQAADRFVSIQARLNNINDGLQTQAELQQKIYNSAQRSRGVYEDTADAVAQLNLLAGDTFKTNDEAIAFMEILNKAFAASGTDQFAQQAAIVQLTQALASGRLQGDEYNSILENAPMIANAIKDYMGVTLGEMRELSSEGVITTDIIKNAVFAAGADIDAMFQQLPYTFEQSMNRVRNAALMAMEPLIQAFSSFVQSSNFEQLSLAAVAAIQLITGALLFLGNGIGSIAAFTIENWSIIKPILIFAAVLIGSLTAAYLTYNAVRTIGNGITYVMTAAELALATARGVAVSATTAQTAAQLGLNGAMLANPITWVIGLIALLIAALVAVGSYLYDLWQTNIDFRVGVVSIWNSLLNFFDQIPIFFLSIVFGISNAFETGRVTVLEIVQSMANGVIDIINWCIEQVNKIPGVSIDALEHVSFATTASMLLEEQKKWQNSVLSGMRSSADAKAAQRAADLAKQEAEWRKEAAQAAAESEDPWTYGAGVEGYGDYSQFLGADANNPANVNVTGGKLDSAGVVTISDEDLKYLKDIAYMEYVNQYTTTRPVVYATFGDVHETADVNKIIVALEDVIEEAYDSALDPVG